MQWMIANMWMALAAATVLGLLFGFSFRGLMVGARIRRAMVERELAKTELTQAKGEIDALYAAQRKRKEEAAQAVGGGESLQAELDERESRIASLGDELSAARDELEVLKSEGANDGKALETAGAAAVGAITGAVLSDDDSKELSELRDRNVWLEERVAALEADVSARADAGAVAATPVEDTAEDVEQAKLNWKAAYLTQRVTALEGKLIHQPVPVTVVEPASEPADPEPVPATEPDTAASAATDEELARLRWRNRYLEGRLAYFEETLENEAVDEPSEPEGTEEVAAETEPAETVEEATDAEDEAVEEPDLEPAPTVVATDDPDPDVHPSEAMLAELDGVQPEHVEKPKNGGDDLTAITGIGPRIAEVLNGLGIWTYQQIAAWQPEHATWVENHLSFKGRVGRENWITQASELIADA